jgi:GDP-L-fucose synthase
MRNKSRFYVAGHTGLIGSAVVRALEREELAEVVTISRRELDLTDALAVNQFFNFTRPNYVVLAAGRVGGILENQSFPADFMSANLAIQLNVLQAAHNYGVEKLILFGSSCMYPRECQQPMSESKLFSGHPEYTSMAYAISKIAGLQMCLAYNQQYGNKRFIPIIPNSAYGPNDNFDPDTGHVLSALMRRFHEAKEAGSASVTLWGSGSPRREFIHADDIAEACLSLFRRETAQLEFPLNLGTGKDISIAELAKNIAKVVGYCGAIEWDKNKPDGSYLKLLDSSRMNEFGWRASVDLLSGLKSTYKWYLSNISNK